MARYRGMRVSSSTPVMPPERASQAWAWVGKAIAHGTADLPGRLPAYTALDPKQLAAAIARGQGQTATQPLTSGTASGPADADPVNLVVTGSLDDLTAALKRAGWTQTDEHSLKSNVKLGLSALFRLNDYPAGPVSDQFLDGKRHVLAFTKNVDHNWARDHLRIYAMGDGKWAIAATRDTALHLDRRNLADIGHNTDAAIDPERDMVMQDLLSANAVASWDAVDGRRPAGVSLPTPGGFKVADRFLTDGRVFRVTLS